MQIPWNTAMEFDLDDSVKVTNPDKPFHGYEGRVVDVLGRLEGPHQFAVLFDVSDQVLGALQTQIDSETVELLSWGYSQTICLYRPSDLAAVAVED